jgi:hypothetical protein
MVPTNNNSGAPEIHEIAQLIKTNQCDVAKAILRQCLARECTSRKDIQQVFDAVNDALILGSGYDEYKKHPMFQQYKIEDITGEQRQQIFDNIATAAPPSFVPYFSISRDNIHSSEKSSTRSALGVTQTLTTFSLDVSVWLHKPGVITRVHDLILSFETMSFQ